MLPSELLPAFLEVQEDGDEGASSQPSASSSDISAHPTTPIIRTRVNRFGLYREYQYLSVPLHDPEGEMSPEDFLDPETLQSLPKASVDLFSPPESELYSVRSASSGNSIFWPYPNKTSFLLGDWYWGSAQKSHQDFSRLINIICDDAFSAADVRDVSWKSIDQKLGQSNPTSSPDRDDFPFHDANWTQSEVKIQVPFLRNTGIDKPKEHTVGTFYHRNIIDVLRDKVSGADFKHFHLHPHRVLWQKPTRGSVDGTQGVSDSPQQVYSELYHSSAFLKAHEEIQQAPSEPANCQLPRAVAALMFASDETHLTQFGDTKLWPLYLYFGNESKYRRCQPRLNLCEHLAYLIKVMLPADSPLSVDC
jgi:hypothetical protein